MVRGRAAGYDDQRELILARAAALFARQGYVGTSMNQVAEACGLSKATLYHYHRDKHGLLVSIAEGHVSRLQTLVRELMARELPPEARLRELITAFVREYAGAQHAHRVLTEDVRFLDQAEREHILAIEREVVAAFAKAVSAVRPDLEEAALAKPMAMLLFGMINWTFTWLKAAGPLSHATLAPLVTALFFGGLPSVATAG